MSCVFWHFFCSSWALSQKTASEYGRTNVQAWFKSFPQRVIFHHLTKKKEKSCSPGPTFFFIQLLRYNCLFFLIKCSKSLAGIGLLNTLPCICLQPCAIRKWSWSVVSTPSARDIIFNRWDMAINAVAIAALSSSEVISLIKDWSIFSVCTWNRFK